MPYGKSQSLQGKSNIKSKSRNAPFYKDFQGTKNSKLSHNVDFYMYKLRSRKVVTMNLLLCESTVNENLILTPEHV